MTITINSQALYVSVFLFAAYYAIYELEFRPIAEWGLVIMVTLVAVLLLSNP